MRLDEPVARGGAGTQRDGEVRVVDIGVVREQRRLREHRDRLERRREVFEELWTVAGKAANAQP